MATVVGNAQDALSSTTESLAGAQPVQNSPLMHQKLGPGSAQPPRRFKITSKFVFFKTSLPSEQRRGEIEQFVFAYLADRYAGVDVTFGNDKTLHVAYGYPLSNWPRFGGLGPEISQPPRTLPGDDKPGPIDGLNPGPVVIGGGVTGGLEPDPVKPIEDALEAAKEKGLIPENETWSFGPVIRDPVANEQ